MSDKRNNQEESNPKEPISKDWPRGYIIADRYKIDRRLPDTLRFQIYIAVDLNEDNEESIDRLVAVKRLRPDLDESIAIDAHERLTREVDVLNRVKHPNVLRILYSKKWGDDVYFISEYADVGTLTKYLSTQPKRKLYPAEALDVAASIGRGLQAVHEHSIFHRDVKPDNIFLKSISSGIVPKLSDFSVAHVPGDLSHGYLTMPPDAFLGTLVYAPPEQLSGIVDARADLYSWAIVCFEILTGEAPETSLKKSDFPHLPRQNEYPIQFFTDRGIPNELAEVMQKSLQTNPEKRYQSIKEVLEVLEALRSRISIANISNCLNLGEQYLSSKDWYAAIHEFEQGVNLCKWYGNQTETATEPAALLDKLNRGHICALGMAYLSERRWDEAISALTELEQTEPNFMGIDIAAKLQQAKWGKELGANSERIVSLKNQEKWTEILIIVAELKTDDDEIRKLRWYAEGQQYKGINKPDQALDRFYQLYQLEPEYEDVRQQCIKLALVNSERAARTQQWYEAVDLWNKAVSMDPSLEKTLQKRISRAKFRARLEDERQILVIIGILVGLIACIVPSIIGVVAIVLQVFTTSTPAPPATLAAPIVPNATPTATSTVMQASPLIHSPTLTATSIRTPTPSTISTRTPSPTWTPSPTFTSTSTPTRTPTRTQTHTLEPTLLPPTVTERPEKPTSVRPTPPTPPPTPPTPGG
jgi:serine/threonine protein kinase